MLLTLVALNSFAETNNPTASSAQNSAAATSAATTAAPPAQASSAAPAQKPPQADQGTRKLSRRERKDRMRNLPEQYRQFLGEVEPIMTPDELDAFLILETDAQRDVYITEFWRRRDAAMHTTNHTFRDQYYSRIEEARERFKQLSSDRGRMFLIQGPPDSIDPIDCDDLLQPLEVWHYEYLQGFGHDVRFIFFLPRQARDYKLWSPVGTEADSLAELISERAMALSMSPTTAVQNVFFASDSNVGFVSKIEARCKNGELITRAIAQVQMNKLDMPKVFDPPAVNVEDVRKMLRSAVLANPNAPKLDAAFSVRYPAKQGAKTDAEMTLLIPRSQLKVKDVDGTRSYSVDITGEVLKDDAMYENYRYRFDFPADVKDEKLAVVIDRFLRPADYTSRVKVSDSSSGAEAVLESAMTVPELLDSADTVKRKEAGTTTVTQLKDDIESNTTRLRIVPLSDDLLSGLQHIETIASGDDIKAVEFYLDTRKVMVKRQPPYTLDLDFGNVPQVHRIRAVALDASGAPLTGDEAVVNTGTDPFRVRIVSPRVAIKVKGRIRVEMSVAVPEGKQLDHLDLFLNDKKVATLFTSPYVQSVYVPETAGVGYLRAVASLKDDPTPPVEDLVMINTPQFMEQVDVHLVELPTTVLVGGKPANDVGADAFKVLDEGKPVKVARFDHVKDLPLSIGLAIDTSGSMQPRMSEAQKAGAEFFRNVLKGGDKAFVVSFDSQPQMVQKWSPHLADLNAGLSRLRAEESTALYDAVVYSLYNFLGVKGQRALVVITDGKDTASKFTWDQAIEYARRAAVPIYGIGIGIRTTEIDVRYKFGKFCAETGGNVYYIDRAADLGRIYQDIQNELRSQYVIGFYPPEGVKPGSKWREVSVQVDGAKTKTIRGYYP
jgi:Ca-activated chloride channel family protein